MDNNFSENKNVQQVQPAQYEYTAPPSETEIAQNPVMLRRKIKKGYGWAGLAMIFQFLLVNTVMVVLSMVWSGAKIGEYMAANPGMTQEQMVEYTQELTASSDYAGFLVTANAVCYLIANPLAFIIGICAVKAFKTKKLFGSPKLGAADIALGVLGALGIQAFSMFAQSIVTSITGITGVNEQTSEMMSFGNDQVMNIIMLVYFVLIAPITEELLVRGFVLNALAPVDRKFALVASALLFGLMHGNFNQMFNGFILGLILGYIALKSGSVITSMIMHIILNANAMFAAYVYEYKMYESAGETAYTYEMIHFAVLLVIGIVALVFFLKRNGKIGSDDKVISDYSYEIEPSQVKAYTWGLFAKCPSVWIVAVIYILLAVVSVTVLA